MKVIVLKHELGFGMDTNTHRGIYHLMQSDGVCLETESHSLGSKITDVVLIDIMLAAGTLNEFNVCRVKVKLEKLGK
jgi:hypothetical protein